MSKFEKLHRIARTIAGNFWDLFWNENSFLYFFETIYTLIGDKSIVRKLFQKKDNLQNAILIFDIFYPFVVKDRYRMGQEIMHNPQSDEFYHRRDFFSLVSMRQRSIQSVMLHCCIEIGGPKQPCLHASARCFGSSHVRTHFLYFS